jgi:hypothetical protein
MLYAPLTSPKRATCPAHLILLALITNSTNKESYKKNIKCKYRSMNPTAPNLHATIKLHKQNTPIRPLVKWRNSPAYNMAKLVTKTLKETLNLQFTYNIENSIQLINNLNNIPINKNTRICSFDINDMYTNIPQQDATHIIHNILLNHNENIADNIQNINHTTTTSIPI